MNWDEGKSSNLVHGERNKMKEVDQKVIERCFEVEMSKMEAAVPSFLLPPFVLFFPRELPLQQQKEAPISILNTARFFENGN